MASTSVQRWQSWQSWGSGKSEAAWKAASAAPAGSIPWIKTEQADCLFAALIVLNALVLGIDLEVSLNSESHDSGPIFSGIQLIFYIVFVIELLLRIYADRWGFFSLKNQWGLFDTFIVFMSTLAYIVTWSQGNNPSLAIASFMRVVRLVRIARIVRLFHFSPHLLILITSLAAALKAVFWVFLMLLVLMYLCCLICAMELGREDNLEEYFGTVDRSFYTHFMILTLEGYPAVAREAGTVSWWWYLYISGFILTAGIAMLNVVTGIIVENVCVKGNERSVQKAVDTGGEEEIDHFRNSFTELCYALGYSADLTLHYSDLFILLKAQPMRELLSSNGICLEVEERELIHILDEEKKRSFTMEQLFQELLRLRGSREMLQSLQVQGDLIHAGHHVVQRLKEVEERILEYSGELATAFQQKVGKRLEAFQRAAERLPAASEAVSAIETPDSYTPALMQVPKTVALLEDNCRHAAAVLEQLKAELQASRTRVRQMEAKCHQRGKAVQTEPLRREVAKQWNQDRELLARPAAILPIPPHRELPIVDLSAGVARLMAEGGSDDKSPWKVTVRVGHARGLRPPEWQGKSHPYCIGEVIGKPGTRFRTKTAQPPHEPVWDEEHVLRHFAPGDNLTFAVWDQDMWPTPDKLLGTGTLTSEALWPHGCDLDVDLLGALPGSRAKLRVNVNVQRLAGPGDEEDDREPWEKTPPPSPVSLARSDPALGKFRSHQCNQLKPLALSVTIPSDGSDDEKVAARKPRRPRRKQASPIPHHPRNAMATLTRSTAASPSAATRSPVGSGTTASASWPVRAGASFGRRHDAASPTSPTSTR